MIVVVVVVKKNSRGYGGGKEKSLTHLFGWQNGNGRFGREREMVLVGRGLVAFERATNSLYS